MKLADILLRQFEPDMAKQLIAFGQKLSKIDADIFVFLARKSLCLYDVLLKLGTPPIEGCVVSDRVLDMRLEPCRGKRVALVDDTLILGTSLAKAKHSLEKVGARVSTHVFCLDKRWHCPSLIVPDSTAVECSDDRIMTFCTAEVRALSIMPRPYLVDFPITRPFRLKTSELDGLLAQTGWTPMKLSTQLQERHGVAALTFFPSDEATDELQHALGATVFKCLDLVKVRLWARRGRDSWIVQMVPIVTLQPMTEKTLAAFNHYLLTTALGDGQIAAQLELAAESARARERLSQFILSAAIGHRFMAGIETRVGRELHLGFDHNETDRQFGPWLHDQMAALIQNAEAALPAEKRVQPPPRFSPSAIPASVRDWTATSIGTNSERTHLRTRQRRDRSVSLLADFAEVFHHIYDNREIPAREEARREAPLLGIRYLDPNLPMPHRDRLQKGVPWQLLVEWLIGLCAVKKSAQVMQTFSLLLDLCNDVGIAVPVTCVEDGIVYRGYRHGEDVKFSDGELALAFDVADGFLETSGLSAIPRLTPLMSRGPTGRAERDLWLTDYLVQRRVVYAPTKANQRKGEYQLGERPQGNYVVSHAPDQAKDLGNIMGLLLRNARGRPPVIDEKALVLLTTCSTPAHTTKALQVELAIFREWFDTVGNRALVEVRLDDSKSVVNTLDLVLRSRGHEALHSARDKFVGFKGNQCTLIIERAATSLADEPALFKRLWQSYWTPFQQAALTQELKTFGPLLDQAAALCWQLAACLSAVEIALCYHQFQRKSSRNDRQLAAAFSKLRKYRTEMRSTGLAEPLHAARIAERFEEIGVLNQTEFRFDSGELVCAKAGTTASAGSAFNPQAALDYARRKICVLGPEVDSLLDLIDPLFDAWGKKSDRVDYSHMLYYDIIDSTATVASRQGQDTEDHRERCHQLKEYINRWFDRSIGEARRNQDEIYPVNGNKTSTNDCKHAFLRGVNARIWAEKIIGMLVGAADSFRMLVRIYLVPCTFVGSIVYRQGLDPDIRGRRFWEHWSRVAKKCAAFEPKPAANSHFLLVATEDLIQRLQFPAPLQWNNTSDISVESEIEFLGRQTFVRYGELASVPPSSS
ncbi:MAG: phosphoribosyltransferase [Verrucomicrobia bacterium]|nr:phosphoribosyltransferase [Verrucomicrobiota bacterium]